MYKVKLSFLVIQAAIAFLAFRPGYTKKISSVSAFKSFAGISMPGQTDDSIREAGKKFFYATCYSCHKDTTGSLAPGHSVLSAMTPRAILAALDNGKMRMQAAALSENDRKAVAVWLTNSELKSTVLPDQAYTSFSYHPHEGAAFDYSGWGGNLAG